MAELTDKQRAFVNEYLIDLNASAACVRAGYSAKYADRMGHKLVENSRVKEAIQVEMDARASRTLITADYVLKGIKGIADIGEKDSDRLKAFELLGKHLKLFTDKIEASGPNDGPIKIKVTIIEDEE